MKPNKNIDRLFQEKLRDLEVTPPDVVWETIEAKLNRKKKRRVIPIWLRYGGVAVLLILLTILGINYTRTSGNANPIENSITDTKPSEETIPATKEVESNLINSDTILIADETFVEEKNEDENTSISENKSIQNTRTEIAKTIKEQENKTLNTNSEFNINQENTIASSTEDITKNNTLTEENTNNIISQNNQTIEEKSEDNNETIAQENIDNIDDTFKREIIEEVTPEQNTPDKRWTVASVVAPVFYNSFSTRGAPLDLQFESNPKEGSQSVSYGVRVGYSVSKKMVIQSGLTVMNVGYTIGDVYINPSPQVASRLANVTYTNTATILNVNAQNVLSQTVIETGRLEDPITGSLNQDYGYIEVPLEMKYNVSNGKLGVHIVAGFSTLFLNSNEVYVETNTFNSDLGEANNLNSVNFSGNFGMDVDYFINKNLFINVNPMIKVHTNTFTENIQNFEPYVIGIYTGLNYKF